MRILTWDNKYGTESFAATTDEELEGAARYVLGRLVSEGLIYDPTEPTFTEEEQELLAMDEVQLASLPAKLRTSAEKDRAYLKRRIAEYEDEKEELARAKRVLAGNLEWELRRERGKHSEDQWAKMVEASARWFGPIDVREDGIYAKDSAWAILQSRDGAEYESYNLDSLSSYRVENW